MKRILASALLVLAGFMAVPVQADVPLRINYQGRVTDSTGALIGDGTPVNRKIIFRIWDHASNSTGRLWTEEQTVTIYNGDFSVLLGAGIDPTGTAASESRPALDTVFAAGGTERFLEILVDDGNNTIEAGDQPISPRQQITSTGYAFRAKFADNVATGTDLNLNGSNNYGLGWYGTGRQFANTSIDGPVLYGNAGGSLGSYNGTTQTSALRWNAAGQVGVGSVDLAGMDATSKMVLQGNEAGAPPKQLTIRGATDTNKRLYLGYNTSSNYGALQAYSGASTATSLLLNPSGGNVGIGVVGPNEKLEIAGNVRVNAGGLSLYNNSGNGATRAMQAGLLSNEIHGNSGPGTDAGQLRLSAGGESNVANKTAIDLYGFDTNDMRFFTNGTERVRVASGGKVGVGTTSPAGKLHVAGVETAQMTLGNPAGVTFTVGNNTGQYGMNFGVNGNGTSWIQGGRTDGGIDAYNISLQAAGGNVGIGTSTPTKGKVHIEGGGSAPFGPAYGLLTTTGAGGYSGMGTDSGVSLWASGKIYGQYFLAFSDQRMKQVKGRSNSVEDLSTLLRIEITDYTYVDHEANGKGAQKKVIAQQVEKVFPQAVSRATNEVPDIYKKAQVEDEWIDLETDLAVGERVRILKAVDGPTGMSDLIHEVTKVADGKFQTKPALGNGQVFVYGREVKDFRSVDYEAIAMLNVSATQQIKKEKDAEVKALQASVSERDEKISALEKRVIELEAKDKARDAKLSAIETLLRSSGKATAQTASLKQGGGAE